MCEEILKKKTQSIIDDVTGGKGNKDNAKICDTTEVGEKKEELVIDVNIIAIINAGVEGNTLSEI